MNKFRELSSNLYKTSFDHRCLLSWRFSQCRNSDYGAQRAALLLLYYRIKVSAPWVILIFFSWSTRSHWVMMNRLDTRVQSPEAVYSESCRSSAPYNGRTIDLHWHVLHEAPLSADDKFWKERYLYNQKGINLCLTNRSGLYTHFVHVSGGPHPTFPMGADCVVIMNHSDSKIDWRGLIYR